MKIAIFLFVLVVGRVQLAEGISCYECGSACTSATMDLTQWKVTCNGLCGFRCMPDGSMLRICSAGYYFATPPTTGTTYTGGDGSKYYFCSGDTCNSGAESCSGAGAPAPTTTTSATGTTTTKTTVPTTTMTTTQTTTGCSIVCQNKGVLLPVPCKCSCPNPNLFGIMCENYDCNAAMLSICNPFTPPDCITTPSIVDLCPHICGACKPKAGSPDPVSCLAITAADCIGTSAQSWKTLCPVTCNMVPAVTCPTIPCLNLGSISPITCTCVCQPAYKGADCGTLITPCPAENPNVCGIQYPPAACVAPNVKILCPKMCTGC